MSNWLNVRKDNNLVAKPFLYEGNSGGKGFYAKYDNPRSVLLGGNNKINPLHNFWGRGATYTGGQSYPQYYRPINYPPFHQPRRKMYFD